MVAALPEPVEVELGAQHVSVALHGPDGATPLHRGLASRQPPPRERARVALRRRLTRGAQLARFRFLCGHLIAQRRHFPQHGFQRVLTVSEPQEVRAARVPRIQPQVRTHIALDVHHRVLLA